MSLSLTASIISLELVVNDHVKISSVALIGLAVDSGVHLLASLDGDGILEVEDSLLPVGVLCVRASAELDGLVASSKLNIEPGDKGMDVIGTADVEGEGGVEGKVGDSTGVEIEGEDGGRVGDDGLHLDGVDKRLGKSSVFEGRVIKAPDIVPDFGVLVSMVFYDGKSVIFTYIQSSPPCTRRLQYQRQRWWPCRGR